MSRSRTASTSPRPAMTLAECRRAQQMRADGCSVADIARRFGCSVPTAAKASKPNTTPTTATGEGAVDAPPKQEKPAPPDSAAGPVMPAGRRCK